MKTTWNFMPKVGSITHYISESKKWKDNVSTKMILLDENQLLVLLRLLYEAFKNQTINYKSSFYKSVIVALNFAIAFDLLFQAIAEFDEFICSL